MKLKPLRDRVIIRRLEEEEVAEGGIVIPDTAKEKPIKGEVIAVGPGRTDENGKLIPMSVKEGDIVVFRKYAGNEITIGDEELLIVDEDDILAIVEK
ncbi:MAG: co-chaperone GroES [candidate division WOR-3 bacterium]